MVGPVDGAARWLKRWLALGLLGRFWAGGAPGGSVRVGRRGLILSSVAVSVVLFTARSAPGESGRRPGAWRRRPPARPAPGGVDLVMSPQLALCEVSSHESS